MKSLTRNSRQKSAAVFLISALVFTFGTDIYSSYGDQSSGTSQQGSTQTPPNDSGTVGTQPPSDTTVINPYPDTSTVNLSDTTPHGPSGHVLGMDISRYQHKGSIPIDFHQAYAVGARFVYINGGNSLPEPDQVAADYYAADRLAAQNAGLYTGLYYYVHFPNTRSRSVLIKNADNQASKVISRITNQGGIPALDLPVALDVETMCVSKTIFGICYRSISKSFAQLWVDRWLTDLTIATGKKPVIYSYLNFFSTNFPKTKEFASYPLWVATAGINPQTHPNGPINSKSCHPQPWIAAYCQLNWSIWQYSSGALGSTFGMPKGTIDLDILNTSLTLEQFVNM